MKYENFSSGDIIYKVKFRNLIIFLNSTPTDKIAFLSFPGPFSKTLWFFESGPCY